MRSVWSGNLAFGLVSIPVKLGSAVSSHKIGFRQVHEADQGRVRYQKTCELDDQVLESGEIGRAFETPDDELVEVTDADLKALPLPTAKTIEISGFLDLAAIDAVQLDTPYFLAPASPAADKPYVLMREALAKAGKAAVGKFAMRNSEHLALVRPRDDVLVLQTLRWPDELNSPSDAAPKGKVSISDNELRLADTLIDALGEADLDSYQDEYAQAVEALVAAKIEGTELPAPSGDRGGKVVDLMAALQASVDQATGGAEDGEGGEAPGATVTQLSAQSRKKATAKKTARKAPAGKSAAKAASARTSTGRTGAAGKAGEKTPAKKAATKKAAAKKATRRRTG
ncbi:non-homologous end joining protein Ku [Actinacidiphila rubida]|uniref:Non-homologous end joining protein Ku n=1 Tax=Actinacidiphila rubida TaxID=310780 RepID=A0A1H8J147_9ACTN|nr:Ku protein [Actinacidiphila rubida]SEN73698.1 DNA end-binding protein Ku [Actinacidiphila rubida]